MGTVDGEVEPAALLLSGFRTKATTTGFSDCCAACWTANCTACCIDGVPCGFMSAILFITCSESESKSATRAGFSEAATTAISRSSPTDWTNCEAAFRISPKLLACCAEVSTTTTIDEPGTGFAGDVRCTAAG